MGSGLVGHNKNGVVYSVKLGSWEKMNRRREMFELCPMWETVLMQYTAHPDYSLAVRGSLLAVGGLHLKSPETTEI